MTNLLEQMGNHSLQAYPNEACGIITKDLKYIPCKNISMQPTNSFIVDPFEILNQGDNILGFFHSHPGHSDPIPSNRDIDSAMFAEYKFFVGFGGNFYRYWANNGILEFERINESYFNT